MSASSKISIIIVTYFTGPSLWKCLNSCPSDHEIIIVNNGNPPQVTRGLKSYSDKHTNVQLIDGNGNIGFAKACNLGAKQAQREVLMFLNPDAVLHPNALGKMLDSLKKLPKLSVVGGRLLNSNGKEQRGARRGKLTPWSALVSMTGLSRLQHISSIFADLHWETHPLPDQPVKVPAVSGACMMFNRKGFKALGGFDDKYFLHVEDLDICRAVHRAGAEVVFVPDAKITHYGSTSQASLLRINWYKTKGLIRYFIKFADSPWQTAGAWLLAPMIFIAVMGRALWLILTR